MAWRKWARSYCTALMLNLAALGTVPVRPTGPRIGIERSVLRGPDRFDPRELIDGTVVTVPLDPGRSSRSGPHAN